jgi:hypothetical protein
MVSDLCSTKDKDHRSKSMELCQMGTDRYKQARASLRWGFQMRVSGGYNGWLQSLLFVNLVARQMERIPLFQASFSVWHLDVNARLHGRLRHVDFEVFVSISWKFLDIVIHVVCRSRTAPRKTMVISTISPNWVIYKFILKNDVLHFDEHVNNFDERVHYFDKLRLINDKSVSGMTNKDSTNWRI